MWWEVCFNFFFLGLKGKQKKLLSFSTGLSRKALYIMMYLQSRDKTIKLISLLFVGVVILCLLEWSEIKFVYPIIRLITQI